jgi:two-component system NtrC family sensor kinase
MQAALQDIGHEAQRCGDIVRNLLRFAREEPTEKTLRDLNEVIQRVVHLSDHYLTNTSLAIRCDLSPHLPPVLINPTEIEQVLVNLLQNAADAGSEDVQVTIQTVSGQGGVHMIVQDNGAGIAAGQVGHIFDPFYSTRRQHGGTGLGLSIVYSIITAHQGTIQVDSTVGQGTTFRITLPSAATEADGS